MGFDRLRIGTRLVMAFGILALLVAVLMVEAWVGIDHAEAAYKGAMAAGQGLDAAQRLPMEKAMLAAHADLQSVQLWITVLGGAVFVVALVAFVSLRRGIVEPLNQAILIAETVAANC